MDPLRTGRTLIVAAYAAFLAANLIHNRFLVDAAIVPSGVFVALMLWKPHRVFLLAAAICVAAPALGFFKPNALLEPTGVLRFLNHMFLLAGGLLAVAAGIVGVLPSRQRVHA